MRNCQQCRALLTAGDRTLGMCGQCHAVIDDDASCSKNPVGVHDPDWTTATVTYDGDTAYVDVACALCGQFGCLGSVEKLTENISW